MITDYLSFTKGDDDVTIKINRHFTITTNVTGVTCTDIFPTESWSINYSFDKTNWYRFTWAQNSCVSNAITLNNTNPTVYIKGYYRAKLKLLSFVFTGGKVYADGNVMSLIACNSGTKTLYEDSLGTAILLNDSYSEERTINQYAFYGLFSGCTNLVTAPKLEADIILKGGCYGMFSNCTNLINAPVIKARTLGHSSFAYMFYNCPNITDVTLYARYKEDNSLTNWLSGTSSNGVIYVNNDIRFSFGNNDKPSSWTTSPIPDTVNVQEFSSDELFNIREMMMVHMTDKRTILYPGHWTLHPDDYFNNFISNFGISTSYYTSTEGVFFEIYLPGIKKIIHTTSLGQDLTFNVPTRSNGDLRTYYLYEFPYYPNGYYLVRIITECGQCFCQMYSL